MDVLQGWLHKWSRKLERYLFGTALIFLALLVLGQLIMSSSRARYYLNRVEFLEGQPYLWWEEAFSPEEAAADHLNRGGESYWIELGLVEGSGTLQVLLNKKVAGVLDRENLTIYCQPGDVIELAGEVGEEPLIVEVLSVQGLAYPTPGLKVVTFGDFDFVGWAVPEETD